MANDLYNLMDQEMLQLYHMRFIQEWTLDKIVKRLGKSIGTISNRIQEIQLEFKKYFDQKSNIYEEAKVVLNILKDMILEKKQVFNGQESK